MDSQDSLVNLSGEISDTESLEEEYEYNQASCQPERSQSQGGGQDLSCEACESLCCQDTLNLYQVKDPHVIKKTRIPSGQRSRQFCIEWYSTYPWLVLCTTRLKAFCGYCRYCITRNLLTHKTNDAAFVSTGFCNWKKALERFNQHDLSNSHNEAVSKIRLVGQPSVVSQLQSQHKKDQEVRRNMFTVVLTSLKHLLRQGAALRGHIEEEGNLMQLLLLRCNDLEHLKKYIDDGRYLSHDIINELVSLMGRQVLSKILSEIREARAYSLIADEATDVSHKEQLCISFRWVSADFTIYERPLELIHVPQTDSTTLTTLIKDCLIRFSLPIAHAVVRLMMGQQICVAMLAVLLLEYKLKHLLLFMYTVWHIALISV